MDPNETLRLLRAWAVYYLDADAPIDRNAPRASDAAEAVQALDDWLSSGGLLPEAWQKVRYGQNGEMVTGR